MTSIAGSVDLAAILDHLAHLRPVFHSEADFQHALAWEVHKADPLMTVRFETHPEPNVSLDLLFGRPDRDRYTAVELKYVTALWSGEINGEAFAIKNHGAQDVIGYHVLKDIARVERFTAGRTGWNGAVVMLTNEPSYWRTPGHGRVTNADAFRIYEGRELAGTREWGPNTGAGTKKGREAPIVLAGSYRLAWRDYARNDGLRGQFRALLVEVA